MVYGGCHHEGPAYRTMCERMPKSLSLFIITGVLRRTMSETFWTPAPPRHRKMIKQRYREASGSRVYEEKGAVPF